MEISTQYVAERFAHFNALCFEGRLVEPPIRLNRSQRVLGQVRYRRRMSLSGRYVFSDFVLFISSYVSKLSPEEVDNIIVHEMIHYHILSNQLHDTSAHGRLFRAEMERVNYLYGLHVTISRREDANGQAAGAEDSVPLRANYVVVLGLADGQWGVMVVATTRLFQMWDLLERSPQVSQMRWYGSTDAFFSRMPRRTTPRYYLMPLSEIEAHLQDAVPLERVGNEIRPKG